MGRLYVILVLLSMSFPCFRFSFSALILLAICFGSFFMSLVWPPHGFLVISMLLFSFFSLFPFMLDTACALLCPFWGGFHFSCYALFSGRRFLFLRFGAGGFYSSAEYGSPSSRSA